MKTFATEQFDLESEIFKPLKLGQQYQLQISSLGRVKRIYKTGKVYYMLGSKNIDGHYTLDVWINRKPKTYKVHRLVFEAFYRKLLPNEVVHHLSQVKTQNFSTNLVAWDKKRHAQYHSLELEHTKQSIQKMIATKIKNNTLKHTQQTKKKLSELRKQYWNKRKEEL